MHRFTFVNAANDKKNWQIFFLILQYSIHNDNMVL